MREGCGEHTASKTTESEKVHVAHHELAVSAAGVTASTWHIVTFFYFFFNAGRMDVRASGKALEQDARHPIPLARQ